MAPAFDFRVTHRDGTARCGILATPHGVVRTPAFMPVGTRGAVKAILQRDLGELGAEILLANTYHLQLRPGADLIARHGGLHGFIGWSGPILTDSGGIKCSAPRAVERSTRKARVFGRTSMAMSSY